jgi:hypothetical protein
MTETISRLMEANLLGVFKRTRRGSQGCDDQHHLLP